jgi:hypothetical protein
MNINIDIELTNNHLPLPLPFKRYHEGKERKDDIFVSKINMYDFFSINEIQISEKIKEIPNFAYYYLIIEKYNFIKLGEINEAIIETSDMINNDKEKYILLQYPTHNSKKVVNFVDFLFTFQQPKHFFFHLFDTYSSLLNTFYLLQKKSICFFDLSCEHILFYENGKPLLQNINNSLLVNNLDEMYISNIIRKVTDYTCKPLEVYVLFYLIINKEETLSYHYINIIVTFFIENMNVLTLFSKKYQETYKQTCIDCLQKYINQPKIVIIQDILKYCGTWDNYSLSIIYLHLIGNIIRVFSLKENIMNEILLLLVKNISPEPYKRETLIDTQKKYEKILYTFTNWEFVKELSTYKLQQFYKLL